MIHLDEVVIVEGKYDKIKLASMLDAVIIETGGFAIFSDGEKLGLIRRMAEIRGVIIMTDSDRAGFAIRSFLRGALPKEKVKNVYIPDILGKEPRKQGPSKEGKLGVEGLSNEVIERCLKRAGVTFSRSDALPESTYVRITKLDLYDDGLVGAHDSLSFRRRLLSSLGLPQRLSANMLVDVLNVMMDRDKYKVAVASIRDSE